MSELEISHGVNQELNNDDPLGSFFVWSPDTLDQDFSNYDLAILMRRGFAKGATLDQQAALHVQLVEAYENAKHERMYRTNIGGQVLSVVNGTIR